VDKFAASPRLHSAWKEISFSFLHLKNSTDVMTNWSIHSVKAVLYHSASRLSVRCSWRGLQGEVNLQHQPPLEGNEISVIEFLLFPIVYRQPVRPIHLLTLCVPRVIYLAGETSWTEINYSRPFRAESNNTSSYTAISSYVFMAYCLVKHKVNFIHLSTWPDIIRFYHLEMIHLNAETKSWLLMFAVCGNADFDYRAIDLLPCWDLSFF